ncbi:MAG TPA: winged helix DNA-binding domain-containing protein [Actinomycetes bacterium]|nr:winged helix DNA-binding domain-containing protein [Actinomycetes bacterium]
MTAVTARLTWGQVRAWRLARQQLVERVPAGRMLAVAGEVCGLHAQVPSSAELQVWARVDGVGPQDVRDALWERRSLVRTWCMRGTLHLLTAEDLPGYVAALRTHDRWWKGAWLRMIGFSAEELRAILDAIADSLGEEPLTREELAERVAGQVGPRARERMLSGWGELLKPAAFEGSLICGPPRGQSVTFVRPDRWLGGWREPTADAAWRAVVRRYLRAYGPATREELARWWGMQPAPAGRVLAAQGDELAQVDVEGRRAWALAEDVPGMRVADLRAPARLLPGFDVYVAGTRPRGSLVDPGVEARVFRAAGWVSPVVLVDGTVAGVWRHERAGGRVEVTVELFRELEPRRLEEIGREADRLGSFLGAPATVAAGPSSGG